MDLSSFACTSMLRHPDFTCQSENLDNRKNASNAVVVIRETSDFVPQL